MIQGFSLFKVTEQKEEFGIASGFRKTISISFVVTFFLLPLKGEINPSLKSSHVFKEDPTLVPEALACPPPHLQGHFRHKLWMLL